MVGIVIVSHSKKLAEGVVDLVRMMANKVPIEPAGGLEDGTYGTSFDLINKAVEDVYSEDGVLVLVDIGSAVMTTEMVIEMNSDKKIVLSNANLVEGAVASSVYSEIGMSLEEIADKLKEEKNIDKF